VGTSTLWLDHLNLAGDDQADRRVHGGPDKAVYVYPVEHLPIWSVELAEALYPGAFGENLTLEGCTEVDTYIGDRWRWGDALLEVSQPRWPCPKLAIHRRRQDIGRMMIGTGRTGWYLRVLVPGEVPVAGPITVSERDPAEISVRTAHDARLRSASADQVAALRSVGALATAWRRYLPPPIDAEGTSGTT